MVYLSEITLIIPTHNRSGYLKRILDYYSYVPLQIIVVDSTREPFSGQFDPVKILYNHFPDMPMPMKIAKALVQVKTRFVAMCADDDFIIPEGMISCINFLNQNKGFVAAQGNNISYKKSDNYEEYIEINPMYLQQLNYEITSPDPFKRMGKLFQPYRTIFSAVHYTGVLKRAFQQLDPEIKNLYLNEYLTAVVPILSGYYKELNLFYQVREFSPTSDDKTTDNLDVISTSSRYKKEFNIYLDYLAGIASEITSMHSDFCRKQIHDVFLSFSDDIRRGKQKMQKISLTKKIGNAIQLVPFIGETIVISRRLKKQKQNLAHIIKTQEEKEQLNRVQKWIKEYAALITL